MGCCPPRATTTSFTASRSLTGGAGFRYEADGLRANDPTQGWRPDGGVTGRVHLDGSVQRKREKAGATGDVTVL
ncbi:MAG: hypothetical protein R2788_10810 [Saprospiraceae bacterium]